MLPLSAHLLTLRCRYGLITFPREDSVIGKSLQSYGEWAQSEIDLLFELVPEGGRVVDVGAYVGTHTLALATRVGPAGRVLAVEGQPAIRALLRENVEQNALGQITVAECAAGATPGVVRFPRLDLTVEANFAGIPASEPDETHAEGSSEDTGFVEVPVRTLDELLSEAVDLLKADVEGMEVPVLQGAERLLARCRPHLYLECASVSNGLRILDFLLAHGYHAYMHRAPAYNPENYFGNASRIFGLARETNLLGVAEERLEEVEAFLSRHPDLAPVRTIDELAVLHLTTVRWGEPEWSSLTKPGLIARITRLLEDQDRLERLLRATRMDQESASAAEQIRRGELEALRGEFEALQRRHEEGTGALREELEAERVRIGAELDDARRALGAKQCELDTLRTASRRELASLETKNAAEAEEARREIESLRRQLAAKDEEMAALEHQMADERQAKELAAIHPPALTAMRRLFDADYYRAGAPEVEAGDRDPFLHYLAVGGREGRDPHRLFDSSFYLDRNPDVRAAGLDPLQHFVVQGAAEGRDPHPLFATRHYLEQAPEAGRPGANPLLHFVSAGFRSGLDPHPLFETSFYLAQASDCLDSGLDPVSHFQTVGAWRGLDPHPLFDTSFYLSRPADCRASGLDPLSHFLLSGPDTADPHPFFDCAEYLRSVPGLEASGINPLVHFVTEGRTEGRLPRPVFELGHQKYAVTDLDQLRHDGRRVVLFLAPGKADRLEDHLLNLAEILRPRCVVLYLRPADRRLLGDAVQGLLALSPLGEEGPGLLFDPSEQLARMIAVVRGVGVTRVHVHWTLGEEKDPLDLVLALGLPFDLSLHEDPAGPGPDPAGRGPVARREAWPRRTMVWMRRRVARRRRLARLAGHADRVIVPAAAEGARLPRAPLGARSIAVDAGDFYPERYLEAEGLA